MRGHLLLALFFSFYTSISFADGQPQPPTCKKLSLRGAYEVTTDETGKVIGAPVSLCNDQCDNKPAVIAPAVSKLTEKEGNAQDSIAIVSLTPTGNLDSTWRSSGLPPGACVDYTLKVDTVWIPGVFHTDLTNGDQTHGVSKIEPGITVVRNRTTFGVDADRPAGAKLDVHSYANQVRILLKNPDTTY